MCETGVDRVMIDIETLGLEPGSAILSIGAVLFDEDGVRKTFYRSISLTSCQEAGLTIDAETLEWWLTQGDEAQDALTGGKEIGNVLASFQGWIRGHHIDEVWANSPSFDCEMLKHAYETVGKDTPWEFYQERDFRTLKELPAAVEIEQDGVEHDALDDAVHQARVAAATLGKLQEVSNAAE